MTQPFSRQDIQEILNNFSIAKLESNFPTAKLVEEKGSMSAVVVAIFDATIKVAASGCNGAVIWSICLPNTGHSTRSLDALTIEIG